MHLWLRHETKPFEQRTVLTPANAKKLIDAGFQIFVEKSAIRAFADADYAKVGCTLVAQSSWPQAPKDAIILGLKELPTATTPLQHTHIYFAHVYKYQDGWEDTLQRYKAGGGKLFDLEYLVDETGRRVAAFGYWAGYLGAFLGLDIWLHQILDGTDYVYHSIRSFDDHDDLLAHTQERLQKIDHTSQGLPHVFVMGANGRCGTGACQFLLEQGLSVATWDREQTEGRGPFEELLHFDVFINCVYLSEKVKPFLTESLLDQPRTLSIISDVSCDPNGPYHPLPIYNQITTFEKPVMRLRDNPVLDLTAIDHLPSLLPKESSTEFSDLLLPHLLDLKKGSPVWLRAEIKFREKMWEMTTSKS